MATVIDSIGLEVNDVALVDASIGNLDKLRKKDAEGIRVKLLASAKRVVFGMFVKGADAGDWVGSCVKLVLKANNGGKPVKARTVTEDMIAKVTTVEMFAQLEAKKTTREADIKARAVFLEQHNYSAADVTAYVKKATEDAAKDFESAQAWINTSWARIPACMKAIRSLGGDQVKTDDGETLTTALAFERVILNRATTARQFCKHVM